MESSASLIFLVTALTSSLFALDFGSLSAALMASSCFGTSSLRSAATVFFPCASACGNGELAAAASARGASCACVSRASFAHFAASGTEGAGLNATASAFLASSFALLMSC